MPSDEVPSSKKLIDFVGFSNITPADLRATFEEGSITPPPLDGMTLNLSVGRRAFTHEPFADADFTQDQADLAAIDFGDLSDNFIRMWSTPQDTEWSWLEDDDWAATEQNVRNFARTAAAGKFAGILLDPEPSREDYVSTKISGQEIFVAPNGDDANIGSFDEPFGTIQHAVDQA